MYGLIAQEVKEAMDKHGITDFNGWTVDTTHKDDKQGISYEMFVIPLLKAVQELSAKVAELEAKIEKTNGTYYRRKGTRLHSDGPLR